MIPPADTYISPFLVHRQAVVSRIKTMGDPPGLDAAHVAQALGEGRGNQATLVVAAMETKGTKRVDFYEVRHTTANRA